MENQTLQLYLANAQLGEETPSYPVVLIINDSQPKVFNGIFIKQCMPSFTNLEVLTMQLAIIREKTHGLMTITNLPEELKGKEVNQIGINYKLKPFTKKEFDDFHALYLAEIYDSTYGHDLLEAPDNFQVEDDKREDPE